MSNNSNNNNNMSNNSNNNNMSNNSNDNGNSNNSNDNGNSNNSNDNGNSNNNMWQNCCDASDFIVVNCDILGFVDFHSLANLFRGENAICALLLLEDSEPNSNKKKKEIKDEYANLENNVWVCIDKNSKVVSIKDTLSMKQNGKLKISKINLLFHKKFILKTDLIDSHVYIFKNYVLDIMENKKNFSSIKYDLIPYLVKIQNTRRAAEYYLEAEFKFNMYKKLINKYEEGEDVNKEGRKDKIIDNLVDKVLIMNIKVKTKMNKKGKKQIGISPISILRHENVESVVCYVQPKTNGFCQRINSIPNFFKANLLFCVSRHDQLKNVLPPYCFFLLSDKNQVVSAQKGN
ncbi:translation initiation factor EIF-2B gamma subunit, putative [Plasmodium malariae]|uniref:Translation initiation factor eIF2B subunit gamma n=1 Tax=Plasmodium malariae TaxID=5858 RepID=A0A1A8W582_PLAMA|nr:translation initiation factor EIF-2B gamma subunit, putative [Plasmodium malariae]